MPKIEAKVDFTLFLAGDAIISAPWSTVAESDFIALVNEIRRADASMVNLETVIHEFNGYPQADSGGAYTASPPEVAGELRWAGIRMVSAANNHSFDYGTEGILETLRNAKAGGLEISGIGADLQAARKPASICCHGFTVSLISMAASFIPYGRASNSRADSKGRPGVNPLSLTKSNIVTVPPRLFIWLSRFRRPFVSRPVPGEKWIRFLGVDFRAGEAGEFGWGKRIIAADRIGNLRTIRQSATESDVTVVAIHSHNESSWLRKFARDCIDNGADIVHVHGVHSVRGIELHQGKIIFYGMGDFVFQTHLIPRFPSDAYEKCGLPESAGPADLIEYSRKFGALHKEDTYQGYAAVVSFSESRVTDVRLLPVDLQFNSRPEDEGRPRSADPVMGKKIMTSVARYSRRFGTEVRYDPNCNEGIVTCPPPPTRGPRR